MARPAKSVALISKNLTKEELELRQAAEESCRGQTDKIVPPKYLNARQKKIFKNLVEEMRYANILSNLDVDILATYAIAVNRIEEIEKQINSNPLLLRDDSLMQAKAKYTNTFFRCQKELCLNPTSRAKMGTMAVREKQKAQDPVMRLLKRSDAK